MGTAVRRHGPSVHLPKTPTAVTIGNFDGLHGGHRALISEVVREKAALGKDAKAIVVSFYPHPGEVLGKAQHLPRITTLHQKLQILSQWGVDMLYLVHFTKAFSTLSAKAFIHDILIQSLNTSALVIGPDARVGHNKEGSPEYITRELVALGKSCRIVSFVDAQGSAISSRRIRSLIVDGDVASAAVLLGRPFAYRSRVVTGDQRGRTLGYPTANLYANEQVVPRFGIYAAKVLLEGKEYSAAVSIGVRPTFSGEDVRMEAFLMDYSGPQFYGATIEVKFIARIRDEKKFSGVEELRTHIENDVAAVKEIFSKRAS